MVIAVARVNAGVVGALAEDQVPQRHVHLARCGLVNDSVKEDDVPADDLVEGQRDGAEIVVAGLVVEGVKLGADVALDQVDEIVEGHPVRQAAGGLLYVEEVVADVVVTI